MGKCCFKIMQNHFVSIIRIICLGTASPIPHSLSFSISLFISIIYFLSDPRNKVCKSSGRNENVECFWPYFLSPFSLSFSQETNTP